ncbi:MAG: hypothetical protein WA865_07985 [Spirulinaceae cyanobacterium]
MKKHHFNIDRVQEPIIQAPPDIKKLIEGVLALEKERLHQKVPRNINEDILKIIKDVVQ